MANLSETELLHQAENARLKGDFVQAAQLVKDGLNNVHLSNPDTPLSGFILGLARIGHVLVTAQIKNHKAPDLALTVLTDQIYASARKVSALPKRDIDHNPVAWKLEIAQDEANRAVARNHPEVADQILKKAITAPRPLKPKVDYDPKSDKWAEFLGYSLAMSVIKGRLARQNKDPVLACDSVREMKLAYDHLQNSERLATLSLWCFAIGLINFDWTAARLGMEGYYQAFNDNPKAAARVALSAVKTRLSQ